MLEPERILRLEADRVVLLDQRRLPAEEVDVECRSAADVAEAIRTMVVRGAPAIGIAAAFGLALAAARGEDLATADRTLRASRPTAVNLGWALDEMRDDPSPEHARAVFVDALASAMLLAAIVVVAGLVVSLTLVRGARAKRGEAGGEPAEALPQAAATAREKIPA